MRPRLIAGLVLAALIVVCTSGCHAFVTVNDGPPHPSPSASTPRQ